MRSGGRAGSPGARLLSPPDDGTVGRGAGQDDAPAPDLGLKPPLDPGPPAALQPRVRRPRKPRRGFTRTLADLVYRLRTEGE